MSKKIRPFYLLRKTDVSGISGVGVVATGCVFSNGRVCMQWMSFTRSIVIFDSVDDLLEVHGHGGATEVVMGDPPEDKPVKRKKPKDAK